jgi:hypothetical protein
LREALAEDRLDDFVRQERIEALNSLMAPSLSGRYCRSLHSVWTGTRWMSDVRSARSTRVVERCLDAPLLLPTARLDRITLMCSSILIAKRGTVLQVAGL